MKLTTNKILLLLIAASILFGASPLLSQEKEQEVGIKKSAIDQMNAGRYGEAIDLLNKYISANPRRAEGYNLRGLSFEKRSQYQYSVLDFRRATRLEPGNEVIRRNLTRVLEIWHAQLRRKIEGHEREIAINPTNPFNYLEIGKSYRWLEEWDLAEQWYDQYLARDDDASPDEIIRYTEILAKTGSIVKGERILNIYVERYPEDWRLWSRYGYFTLWLSKYKTAKEAFEMSLSFKPFFKEAQDGLDLATRQAYVNQADPRAFEKVYPIDRYYRMIRRDPTNVRIRFQLVDELIKADRIEEAYQQLQILGVDHSDEAIYQEKWDFVVNYREETYRSKVEILKEKLAQNPKDVKAVKEIATYYEYLLEYDTAFELLDNFFFQYPEVEDPELRFQYARISAWNRDFDMAIEITDLLLDKFPNNLDYQLFRAQLSVWNSRDLDLAREYLSNVLNTRPSNLEALISMGSLMLLDRDYDAAQAYADKARNIDALNDEVIKLQSNIDFQKMRAEEEERYAIIERGREKVLDGDCEGALSDYEEYLAQAEPNVLILKEYGDVHFCAKNYEDALGIYNQVLEINYDFDVAVQRAKVLYAKGDSLEAVDSFRQLIIEDSTSFEARLYLGDSYVKVEEFDSAAAQYELLSTWVLDSTETAMVEMRKKWIPVTGLDAILSYFPNYIGAGPSVAFYSDNLAFQLSRVGARVELGITYFLTLSASYHRSYTHSTYNDRSFTSFKGGLSVRFSDKLTAGFLFGTLTSQGSTVTSETDLYARYDKKNHYFLNINYSATDAALLLYSPDLINARLNARLVRFDGYYKHRPTGLIFSSSFQYVEIVEWDTLRGNNQGNDFTFRIGKGFFEDFSAGYEYYYSNYKYDSDYYYSPRDFESHSLWLDFDLEKNDDNKVILGGKIGTIPANEFMVLEGHIIAEYKLMENFTVSARISLGTTSRDESTYKYFSGQLSAYWNL